MVNQLSSHAPSTARRSRAALIGYTTVVMMVLYGIYALFSDYNETGLSLVQSVPTQPLAVLHLLAVYGGGIATLLLLRLGRLDLAAYGPLLMLYFGSVLQGAIRGYTYGDDTPILAILIFLSSLLTGSRGLVGTTVVAMVTFTASYFARPQLGLPAERITAGASDLLVMPLIIVGMGVIGWLHLRNTTSKQVESRLAAAEDRLRLAEITTELAQRVSQRLTLSDVLNNAVEQIVSGYNQVYHAQIFLIGSDGRRAELVASTGEAGRLLLERQHYLDVGSVSVIGQVTASGDPVIARSGVGATVHRHNEFLPDTRVEAAFPLRLGGRVIGALDLQSQVTDSFTDADRPIFQALADSIAVAIDNARLFDETEQRLRENQRLLTEVSRANQQNERLNRQLTEKAWSAHLGEGDRSTGLTVNFDTHSTQHDSDLTATLTEALQHNYLVQQTGATGEQIIAVPLRVRGQVIGAMEFELDASGQLTPEDLDLIQQISERFGDAAETNRLFADSRRVARREAVVNEISARLQKSNDIKSVLHEAAQSLHEILRADTVTIRLGSPPASPTNGRNGADIP